MRAIKFLVRFLLVLMVASSSYAREEDFAIFQFKKKLADSHLVLFDYVRRDRVELFEKKYMDLIRLSWGGTLGDFNYLVGGAYVDFEKGADEKRLHQFLIRNFSYQDWLKGFARAGLEERSFIGDDKIYLRTRWRAQLNLNLYQGVGPVFYDEVFHVVDGQGRLADGFNENRFGVGVMWSTPSLDFYVFNVSGYSKSLKSTDKFEWLQIQSVFSF